MKTSSLGLKQLKDLITFTEKNMEYKIKFLSKIYVQGLPLNARLVHSRNIVSHYKCFDSFNLIGLSTAELMQFCLNH